MEVFAAPGGADDFAGGAGARSTSLKPSSSQPANPIAALRTNRQALSGDILIDTMPPRSPLRAGVNLNQFNYATPDEWDRPGTCRLRSLAPLSALGLAPTVPNLLML